MKTLKPEDVKYIVIHASATRADQDWGAAEIEQWHRERGFRKIGYHFVIRRDGSVEYGRGLTEIGAHVKGYNNNSIGICQMGGIDAEGNAENNFTEMQFDALAHILRFLKRYFPNADVVGHRDLPGVQKECPCFDVNTWLTDRGEMQ